MDNKELEDLLHSRFASVREGPALPSLVPDIMERVRRAPDPAGYELSGGGHHDWVLVFAWLLGTLVCAPAVQGLDVQSLLGVLSFEVFGAYAQLASAIALPLLGIVAMLPVLYVALED